MQVTRADGKKLWVNVTLPPDYREGTRLPAMFWFYPYEYTDQEAYDRTQRTLQQAQVPDDRARARWRSWRRRATRWCSPTCRSSARAGRLNDNYVTDLRNGLTAVIDELDRAGDHRPAAARASAGTPTARSAP